MISHFPLYAGQNSPVCRVLHTGSGACKLFEPILCAGHFRMIAAEYPSGILI